MSCHANGFPPPCHQPSRHGSGCGGAKGSMADLSELSRDGRVVFFHEPSGIESEWRRLTQSNSASANNWNDAYLAAFASIRGLKVVSFDRGFAQLSRNRRNHSCLKTIPHFNGMKDFLRHAKKMKIAPTPFLLVVSVAGQTVSLFEQNKFVKTMSLFHVALWHRANGRLESHAAGIASHRGKNRRG